MKNISFKTKILLLTLAPLVIVSILTISLAVYQAKELGNKNISSFSEKIFELRRAELKNYTDIAITAVKHLTEKGDIENKDTQEEVKEIIRNMSFGQDGYFYAYDKYTTLAHPKVRSLEGKNQRGMTDPQGVKIIEELYKQAVTGGGITSYVWLKPSRKSEVEKLGYSDTLEGWDWWIGTGLYVDDLDDAVLNLKSSVNDNISTTLKLILSLALGTVIIVGLIGARFTISEGRLADEKLQKLSRKAVESQEEERGRVAHELQKGINTALYAARSKLVDVAKESSTEKARAKEDFISAVSILDKTIQEVYRISGELRPEILDTKGLYSAISELSEKVSAENDVTVVFTKTGENKRLKADLETSMYRIVQEALNNIVDHSHSSEASIKINQTDSMLNLTIQDNGSGFNAKEVMAKGGKGSVGFTDIQVRAQSLGGYLHVFSTKEVGTIIRVTIPLQ